MNLIISGHRDGSATIHFPRGADMPYVVWPEIWVGENSTNADEAINLAIFHHQTPQEYLFQAIGYANWQIEDDSTGETILKLFEPEIGWKFTIQFLRFWLSLVFGEEVSFSYIDFQPIDS